MAYIASISGNTKLVTYLTNRARYYLATGQGERVNFVKYGLGDSDINYQNLQNLPNEKIPEATGEAEEYCLLNIYKNVGIKHHIYRDEDKNIYDGLFTFSSQVRGFDEFITRRDIAIAGQDLEYFIIDRNNNTDNKNHLFTTLGIPVTDEQKTKFAKNYGNTALRLVDQDKVLIFNIQKHRYLQHIDGKTVKFTIPFSGGTNGEITLHGTYFKKSNDNDINYDDLYSDPNFFTEDFAYKNTEYAPFDTNTTFLFSDDISQPISGGTWKGKIYNETDKSLANFSSPSGGTSCEGLTPNGDENGVVDTAIGMIHGNKGFVAIFHPDIVSEYESLGTGGTSQDSISFNATTIKSEFMQVANILPTENIFNTSSNPTFDPDNNPFVYITEVGVYNEDNELMAYGKFTRPIIKGNDPIYTQPFSFRVTI